MEHIVVSMTSFETSSKAFNVIPAEVELRGTIRTMASDVRVLAEQRIKDIARLTRRPMVRLRKLHICRAIQLW